MEITKGVPLADIPVEHHQNLTTLEYRMNAVRRAYDNPMSVTSGYRTMKDHLRIYRNKGITDESRIPMKSKHLFGNACDIYDPSGELKEWCNANQTFLRQIGIWLEDFKYTSTWVHFQIVPYGSYKLGGSIWFRPW